MYLTKTSGTPIDKITTTKIGTVSSLSGYRIDASEQENPRVNGTATNCAISAPISTKKFEL